MGAWDHNYLWVLDVGAAGGTGKIVSVARDTGYGICAKFHDGDPSDDARWGFQENFRALASACKDSGVPLIAWGYCYGNTYRCLAKEYRAAIDSFGAGAQAYVIDAEVEWEVADSSSWATEFVSSLKAAVPGAEIGVTTFWNLRWHPAFPGAAFARAGAVAMPQVYYASARRTTRRSREEMHAISRDDFSKAGFASVYPVGEIAPGPNDLVDFLEITGESPHSLWLLDGHQDGPAIQTLRSLESSRKLGDTGSV